MPLPAQDQRQRRQCPQRRGAAALAPSQPRVAAAGGVPAGRRTRRADAQDRQSNGQPRPRTDPVLARPGHAADHRGEPVDDKPARSRPRRHDRGVAADPRPARRSAHHRDHRKHARRLGAVPQYRRRAAAPRRPHLSGRLRHRMVVSGSPAGCFGRRAEARQGIRGAPRPGPAIGGHRAVHGGVGRKPRRRPRRRGSRRRGDVGSATPVRLQHHPGLRAHSAAAGRRPAGLDQHPRSESRCQHVAASERTTGD